MMYMGAILAFSTAVTFSKSSTPVAFNLPNLVNEQQKSYKLNM